MGNPTRGHTVNDAITLGLLVSAALAISAVILVIEERMHERELRTYGFPSWVNEPTE